MVDNKDIQLLLKNNVSNNFFLRHPTFVASDLIGKILVYKTAEVLLAGIIKETEAYTEDDPASHSYLGKRTKRNQPMFDGPGTIYIYQVYGMHFCLNFSCEKKGVGSAVLIRELVPLFGLDIMKKNRSVVDSELTNGPAKLVQALGVTPSLNAVSYHKSPLFVTESTEKTYFNRISQYSRIGVSKGLNVKWRFRGE
ncbi:3-methyladenine DNA glycosylase [bacterium]|nr:3-methyladenine DNA glycosylase [bacterium]